MAEILCQEKRQLMNFEGRTQYKLLNKAMTLTTTGNKINHFIQIFQVDTRRYYPHKKERRNKKEQKIRNCTY